jgi:hypothetical protein
MRNRKRKKNPRNGSPEASPIDVPIADEGEISQTTIYPTIEAMWAEFSGLPWLDRYSPGTQRTIRFAFYTAVAETMRTVSFRANSDQDFRVFDEFDRELRAYDKELQRAVQSANAELH